MGAEIMAAGRAGMAEMVRCRECGRLTERAGRCPACGRSALRLLRRDEFAAWAALEEEGALTPEERRRAVMVRCGMEG